MSLLQDALRKAQRGSGSPGGGTPLPEPGPFSPVRGSRRALVRAAVLVLLLLAVAALYLYRNAPVGRQVAASTPETPSVPAQVPSASSSPPASPPAPVSRTARSPETGPAVRASRSSPAKPAKAPVTVAADRPVRANEASVSLPSSPGETLKSEEPVPAGNPPQTGRAALLARYNEGVLAREQGEWESSARIFREIVDIDSSVIEAWNGLGFSLMRLGRLTEAEAAISRALSLSPNYAAAVVNEGLLRLQEGRTAESAERFERAVSLDPSNPVPQVNLAIAQAILGRTRESEQTLSAARRRFPANPEILYNLGALYERTGDRERSAEAYAAFLSASRGRFPAKEAGVRDRLRAWGVIP